jgi:hypothetical protein
VTGITTGQQLSPIDSVAGTTYDCRRWPKSVQNPDCQHGQETSMKARMSFVAMAMLLGVVTVCAAQVQMPKPAPELKNYDYFAGTWKLEGEAKPGPMGPGGKMTMTEEIHWMKGGFFLVTHSTFSGAGMGEGTGISIMGYDPDEKKYTYNEFNSFGEATKSAGTFDGKTWTWLGEDKTGKGKFTIPPPHPTRTPSNTTCRKTATTGQP